jgi:hypothetical protein
MLFSTRPQRKAARLNRWRVTGSIGDRSRRFLGSTVRTSIRRMTGYGTGGERRPHAFAEGMSALPPIVLQNSSLRRERVIIESG